jgi:NAD(P)-dependent dehydrogenase (short-subunit alcohol dehydrogenase family)
VSTAASEIFAPGLLDGQVALITGGGTGLGRAAARELVACGARVVLVGRRAEVLEATAAGIGEAATCIAGDIRDDGDAARIVETALARHGRIDLLVNNAATIAPMARLADLDAIAFDRALTVNVSGPVALVAALWPHLGGGRIINVVSGAANRAMPGWAAYCASKAALMMLTKSIELEGAEAGIRAFGFAPGLVDTDMQAGIRAARINDISNIPRENLLPPSRPAAVIAWLASGKADDLAGQYTDIRAEGLLSRVDTDLAA